MPASIDVIHIHPEDNICVAARNLPAGVSVAARGQSVELRAPIRMGHKIALCPISEGRPVIKYGQTIGVTTKGVQPGDWVHSHNLVNGEIARHLPSGERNAARSRSAFGPHVSWLSPS